MRISDWSSDVCSSDLAAFAAARRVRRDTPIGQQASSMAQVAVEVARDLFGRFEGLSLLWLGLGEMGEMLGADFATAGVGKHLVMPRLPTRAQPAGRRLGFTGAPGGGPAREGGGVGE